MKRGLLSLVLALPLAIGVAWLANPLVAWGGAAAPADEIQVVSLTRDGVVYVSFTLAKGLSEDLRDALQSGLPTTIAYEIDLCRLVPVWFDKTVASATVTATAQYDNLTRLHQLSRSIDGRAEEPRVTGDQEVVRQWLTTFERLPLFKTAALEPNTEYYIRVRARSKPRLGWFAFWPFEHGTATGYAHFTFIPS